MPAKLAGFIFLEILPATATAAKKPTTTKVKEIKLSLSSPAAAVATSGGSDFSGGLHQQQQAAAAAAAAVEPEAAAAAASSPAAGRVNDARQLELLSSKPVFLGLHKTKSRLWCLS